jgi:signal transduction histidine kinase
MRTRSLRSRIIIAFTVLGLSISFLFGLSVIYVRNSVEDTLINNQLQKDVDLMVEQVKKDPSTRPGTSILEAWMHSTRTLYKLPLAWQKLETGVYDLSETPLNGERVRYKLAVQRDSDLAGFVRYNVDRDELTSQQILVAVSLMVLSFSVLSFFVGRWSSSRVILPVLDLAHRLQAVKSEQSRTPLAPHFPQDEVGELAEALDDYNNRIRQLIDRDREFNANVSHELRTPLAVIFSTTELMTSMPGNTPKLEERIGRIRRAALQGSQLIEALLLISRNEVARPPESSPTSLSSVVGEVVENCRSMIQRKPVTLNVVTQAEANIAAPESVVAVVLSNLIGNACRYTQKGSVEVTIAGNELRVADTGMGLSDAPEALFERGFRGDHAPGIGGGLGLSIVKRVCDLYGWEVRLEQRPSGGSLATLRL